MVKPWNKHIAARGSWCSNNKIKITEAKSSVYFCLNIIYLFLCVCGQRTKVAFKYLMLSPYFTNPLKFSVSSSFFFSYLFSPLLSGSAKMISKFRKASNLVDHKQNSVAVGLKILIQISQGNKSNIIVKSSLRLSQPTPEFSCFLKTCHLCNKGLSLEKEVYMYR